MTKELILRHRHIAIDEIKKILKHGCDTIIFLIKATGVKHIGPNFLFGYLQAKC